MSIPAHTRVHEPSTQRLGADVDEVQLDDVLDARHTEVDQAGRRAQPVQYDQHLLGEGEGACFTLLAFHHVETALLCFIYTKRVG